MELNFIAELYFNQIREDFRKAIKQLAEYGITSSVEDFEQALIEAWNNKSEDMVIVLDQLEIKTYPDFIRFMSGVVMGIKIGE